MKKKVLLITHTDLDGVGCALVAKQCMSNADIKIESVDYNQIDKVAQRVMYKDYLRYDWILFTDISPREEYGRQLLEEGDNIFIIDHHKPRDYLSEYPGSAYYNTSDSATLILWRDFFLKEVTNTLVMQIDAWDSWKLKSPYRQDGILLNYLFQEYQFEKFRRRGFKQMNKAERNIARIAKEKDEQELFSLCNISFIYVDRKNKKYLEILVNDNKHHLFGLLIELLKKKDSKKYKSFHYIKIINNKTKKVSLYSDKIDVSKIAEANGGGGHKGAAGYYLNN